MNQIKFTDQFKFLSKINLKKNQIKEYDLIQYLSKRLIIGNFNRKTKLLKIKYTTHGYSIHRISRKKDNCNWNINIDLTANEATITFNN